MKCALLGIFLLCFASIAQSAPIFNEVVGLDEPIFLTIHPDSAEDTQFWFYPSGYYYCREELGQPEFRYVSFLDENKPTVVIDYKLCAQFDANKINRASELLVKKNPLNKLSMLRPEVISIDGLWNHFKDTFQLDLNYHCSVENIAAGRVACQINSQNIRASRHLYNVFTGFIGLITNGYFSHFYAGVEKDSMTGKYNDVRRINQSAFGVRGLQDHSRLFQHGWVPEN